jgi:hypothetical protein
VCESDASKACTSSGVSILGFHPLEESQALVWRQIQCFTEEAGNVRPIISE